MLGRRRRILGAGDRERRRRDRAELAAQVVLAQELAVAHVHLGRRRDEHRAEALHVAERRREPARQDGVGDRLHAAARGRARSARPRSLASPKRADVHASTSRRAARARRGRAACRPRRRARGRRTRSARRRTSVEHALREVARRRARRSIGAPPWPGARRGRRRSRCSASACASHIALVAPSEPQRTTVLIGDRTRARGRRTRRPSRGSPPARARPARSARPRTASRRAGSRASARRRPRGRRASRAATPPRRR